MMARHGSIGARFFGGGGISFKLRRQGRPSPFSPWESFFGHRIWDPNSCFSRFFGLRLVASGENPTFCRTSKSITPH